MSKERPPNSLAIIPAGAPDDFDPKLATEGKELIKAFLGIASEGDRRRVIELATTLAKQATDGHASQR